MSEFKDSAGSVSAPAPRRTARVDVRGILRQVHLWTGLILCLPLVVLGLTGSYLVYHDEIDGLIGGVHFEATTGAPREASEIVDAAMASAPQGFVANLFILPEEAGEPATVRVGPKGASFRDPQVVNIVIDPSTLEVLGQVEGGLSGVTRLMHDLHGRLLIPGREGRQAVGWLGVVMLFLGVSGLVIWWPRPGRLWAALTIKRGARDYRLNRDLHGSVGFWTLIVFVIVSFTGVYIAFPQSVRSMTGIFAAEAPGGGSARPVRPIEGVQPMTVGEIATMAGAAVPEASMRMIVMPFRPGSPARARFGVPGAAAGAPSIDVMVDPWRREVVEIRDPRSFGTQEAIQAWQRPLHEGAGLGWLWRFAVFVSGLLPLLFAITGVTMWVLKRRARNGSQKRVAA